LAVTLYPVAWLVGGSFKPQSEIGGGGVLPLNPTTQNYTRALEGIGGTPAWLFFANSAILGALAVTGVVLSSSLAAYAFARLRFRLRGLFFALTIGTMLLPVHVTIVPQYIIFQRLGLVDTFAPLVLGKFLAVEAFFTFLMVQFLRAVPRELDEAARLDGCGHFRTYWYLTLPMLRPAIVTSSVFAFVWSWNDFLGPLIYLNTPSKYPLPSALRVYVNEMGQSNFGALMALSVLAIVPVAIFFFFFQRYLVEGVATQGLKG
jgi:multiple sugar transport system permease protein